MSYVDHEFRRSVPPSILNSVSNPPSIYFPALSLEANPPQVKSGDGHLLSYGSGISSGYAGSSGQSAG